MSTPEGGHGGARGDVAALGLFCAATLGFFAGIFPELSNSIGPHAGDPVFNLYVLKWGSHQISTGFDDFWNAPIYHPTLNATALSDHLLGPAVVFHVLRLAGASPLAAYNLLVLATFVLGGGTAYWVVRRSGVSWTGAVIAGWVFAFSTFRWGAMGHYQALRMQWIPLTVWTFDRVLAKPTPGRAAAFLVFYALHVSGGAYLAYLVHLVLLVLLVNRWLAQPATLRAARSWAVWMPTAALALGAAAFFYAGYVDPESTLMAGQRPDAIRRGAPVLAWFAPDSVAWLLPGRLQPGRLFPGHAVLLFTAAGLWWGWRRFAAPRQESVHPAAGAGLAAAGALTAFGGLLLADRFTRSAESLVPALTGDAMTAYLPPLLVAVTGAALFVWGLRTSWGGPALRWQEMPVWPRGLLISGAVMLVVGLPAFFWLVSTVLPGMQSMRVPQRAFAFAALPLAYLVGVGWDRLWSARRPGGAGRLLPGALAVLLLAETVGAKPPERRQNLPREADFPAYAHWIAEHPEVGAYLELPLGRVPHSETVPMYLQTLHWRPLANGYSGRHTPSYDELMRLCRPFPHVGGLRQLAARGITHLVVHWRALPWHPGRRVRRRVPGARPAFEQALRRYGARKVFADGDTVIFDLRSEAEAGAPAGDAPS